MKNFLIAVLIAFVLVKIFGGVASNIFDMHIVMGDDLISEPLSWLVTAGITILVVGIGFIVAMSIAAAIGIAALAVFGVIIFAGIGAFWPLLLIIALVYFISRPKNSATV